MDNLTEKEATEILFGIFSAGYEAGYAGKVDLATSFKSFLKDLQEAVKNGDSIFEKQEQ